MVAVRTDAVTDYYTVCDPSPFRCPWQRLRHLGVTNVKPWSSNVFARIAIESDTSRNRGVRSGVEDIGPLTWRVVSRMPTPHNTFKAYVGLDGLTAQFDTDVLIL